MSTAAPAGSTDKTFERSLRSTRSVYSVPRDPRTRIVVEHYKKTKDGFHVSVEKMDARHQWHIESLALQLSEDEAHELARSLWENGGKPSTH